MLVSVISFAADMGLNVPDVLRNCLAIWPGNFGNSGCASGLFKNLYISYVCNKNGSSLGAHQRNYGFSYKKFTRFQPASIAASNIFTIRVFERLRVSALLASSKLG